MNKLPLRTTRPQRMVRFPGSNSTNNRVGRAGASASFCAAQNKAFFFFFGFPLQPNWYPPKTITSTLAARENIDRRSGLSRPPRVPWPPDRIQRHGRLRAAANAAFHPFHSRNRSTFGTNMSLLPNQDRFPGYVSSMLLCWEDARSLKIFLNLGDCPKLE